MQQLQVAVRRQGGQEQQELFEAPVPSSYVEHKLEQKYGPGALCLEGSNVMLAPALTLQPSQRCVYDVFGGAAAGRGSDDASAKSPGASPKLTTTSVTTVALADNKVTLRKRFPGIVHARMDVEPQLQPEALEFVTNALLRPALSMLSRSQLSTEAARVHVVGLMLLEALILFTEPQQEAPLMLSACHSSADSLGICEQAGQQAKLQLGFEQHFRAGSFKGRVELQVLHTTQQGGDVFAGAVEVKQEGRLIDHVEQAKKEAFAMWCHNARQEHFEPVWVVLTDLSKVLRVTYEGHNSPGGPGQPYRPSMPCDDVRGTMRCTDDVPFIVMEGLTPLENLAWPRAVQCFVGGLLGQCSPNVDELQQRASQHNSKIEEQLKPHLERLAAEAQRPSKRPKGLAPLR